MVPWNAITSPQILYGSGLRAGSPANSRLKSSSQLSKGVRASSYAVLVGPHCFPIGNMKAKIITAIAMKMLSEIDKIPRC